MARTLTGVVVSDKSAKTIVVAIHTSMRHPLYKKQYSTTNKIVAHDEKEEAKMGDTVVITECRPLSARKRFVLSSIVSRAKITHVENSVPDKTDSTKEATS